MATFLARYEEAKGEALETVSFGALAADGVILMVDAFVRSGYALDGVAVGEALKGASGVPVVTGTVTYAGSNGVQQKPVYILQVKDGQVTLAATVEGS